jgi:hypothetical protein
MEPPNEKTKLYAVTANDFLHTGRRMLVIKNANREVEGDVEVVVWVQLSCLQES